ncbi:MAG: T9SS type A sorting domain-containing protein [Ignavibacteria bacterium]|nr:T9SS type A sorting domain-containing protein [Ignavibacteria bacterium]
MKKLLPIFLFIIFSITSLAQVKLQEGFETSDSLNLPAGWTRVNNATFPIDPWSNWTVRDTGKSIPGLATSKSVAHSGIKSCMASWWCGVDTTNSSYHTSDAWLITKRIYNIQSTDVLKFWACGGSPSWADSLQIWVSTTDSNTYSFLDRLGTIIWPAGSTYGNYQQYTYSLALFTGSPVIWIGFRYYMDCVNGGFCVFVDDVFVGNPAGINQVGNGIPKTYELKQNYPNPFNPSTTIRFDIPKRSNIKLVIYNSLGQEIIVLDEGSRDAGTYEYKFDAVNLPSGIYFYRLFAGEFIDTKKMILVK